jgi:hypothetical protein
MWARVIRLLRNACCGLYRYGIDDALALHKRGEARRDGLTLDRMSLHLEIRWQARDTHPWDQNLNPHQRAVIFAEQTALDTEAAVHRMFARLPEVDVLDLGVIEPNFGAVIASGTVERKAVAANSKSRSPSARMRLANLGVCCSFAILDSVSGASTKHRAHAQEVHT